MGGSPIPQILRSNRPAPAPTPKAEEQPKVEAQMEAPKPDENAELVSRKKRGRKSLIASSVTGVEEPAYLSKKTLLG